MDLKLVHLSQRKFVVIWICRKRSDFCIPLWKARYLQHNAAVRASVPKEQLLVYKVLSNLSTWNIKKPNLTQVGGGWEQLCNFLGKPIPDAPWPHENKYVVPFNRFRAISQIFPQGRELKGKHCSPVCGV